MRNTICPTSLHFHDLAAHFLALSPSDRTLRFGWAMSDDDIVVYVETIVRRVDPVFMVVEPTQDVSGVVHLEFTGCGADLGLSVSPWARSKGVGSSLLERACLLAAGRGVAALFVHKLGDNEQLQRLAQRAGLQVVCAAGDGAKQREPIVLRNGGNEATPGIALVDHSLRPDLGTMPAFTLAPDETRQAVRQS